MSATTAEFIEVRGQRYELHPACAIFPEMSIDELMALGKDIKENGLTVPIVRYKGKILDGRNRLKACASAGVAPVFTEWDGQGGSPTRFAVAVNFHRRNLSTSQRAAIGAELVPMFAAEAKERKAATQVKPAGTPESANLRSPDGTAKPEPQPEPTRKASEDAARAVNVSPRAVEAAKALKGKSRKKFNEVKAGKKTVHAAAKEVKAAKAPPKPPNPHEDAWKGIRNQTDVICRVFGEIGLVSAETGALEETGRVIAKLLKAAKELESRRVGVGLPEGFFGQWAETARRASKGLVALAKAAKEF